jgi:hypothetical protein
MEYNTTREKLVIPEYGRNVQKLIDYTVNIKDKDERTRMAYLVVNIMAQMNPQVRESGDYKRKLWDHMFIISDFKLDVDAPYPVPSPDQLTEKPTPIEYKENEIAYRHYGMKVELIIKKAREYEDGEEKDALVKTIANHLKKSYLNWNRDSVNDELIHQHLSELSEGKLKLSENEQLTATSENLAKTRKKKFSRGKDNSGGRDNHRRRKPSHSNHSKGS